jgi:hypothetical protein
MPVANKMRFFFQTSKYLTMTLMSIKTYTQTLFIGFKLI